MGYIVKQGRLIGIGRNVKFTLVPNELKEKRKALFTDTHLIDIINALDSGRFYDMAKKDPVIFTYAMWRLFQQDAAKATDKLCELAIYGNAKEVLKALELMFFDASKKINAFCLGYIISKISEFIDTNPRKVKMAVKKVLMADFLTALRVMKGMYEESPRITKEIGKKLMSGTRLRMLKKFIRPVT
jgi:hypothetical protein